ncbi:MAG: hypothetical protein methR_P1734 [Methyloprofundus sp.]|nr:MAG: hypothetical protein methR_P1734 [Methyloprofundus sp.]
MNNFPLSTKASRLTEQEVHTAIQNLLDADENISSLALLKALGRGSLTTITKYLNTFNLENVVEIELLQGFAEIPESLADSIKHMSVKIWNESQALASQELDIQRAAMQKIEIQSSERIQEAEAFSEEQAKRLEQLEKDYATNTEELSNIINALNLELEGKTVKFNKMNTQLEVLKSENTALIANLQKSDQQLTHDISHYEQLLTESKATQHEKIDELDKALKIMTSDKTYQVTQREMVEQKNIALQLQVSKQQLEMDLLVARLNEEQALQITTTEENKSLREKAAMLDGELKAWKTFIPEEP